MGQGDESAGQRLMSLIYEDLRGLARRVVRTPAAQNTLTPTALVHEAYGRLVGRGERAYRGRTHFMCTAARAMRQLLTDHARGRGAERRGGGRLHVTLGAAQDARDGGALLAGSLDLQDLNEALERLTEQYPRQAKVVELRFLGGLSVEETAEVLGVSPRTVKFDWQMARAWLSRALQDD